MADLADLADLDLADSVGPAEPEARVEPKADQRSPLPPVRSGSTQVVPAIGRAQLEAIRTGNTALVSRDALLAAGLDVGERAGPSRPPLAPPPEPATSDDAEPRAMPWMWIGIGGAAIALVALIAFAATGDGDDDSADEDDAVARADGASEDDAPGSADASVRKDPADPDDPAQRGEVPEAPDGAPEVPGEDQRTRVGRALRTRTVRALDVLLVSNTAGPLSWEAAAEHCSGLDVEGISKWRLPEVGELMSLSGASMTESGYYWSSTPADTFGDARLAWYDRRSRVVTRDRESLVLCVRGGSASG